MLNELRPNPGSRRPRKRLGRGIGSGTGKTCGRGTKGYGARAGSKRKRGFEGGQMPLQMRLPKRGFTNIFRSAYQVVNVKELARFEAGATVDAAALSAAGLVSRADRPVKILSEGECSVKVALKVAAISAAARQKVEAAGGSVELVATGDKKADS